MAWDALILALVVFSCLYVPYQFSFSEDKALSGFQFIYLVDLVFLADIALNCFTSYFRNGVEILDRRACTAHYARTMMPIDLLASVPWDLFAWLLLGDVAVFGVSLVLGLRLLRLLRLIRLFVIFRRWERLHWVNPAVPRIAKILVTVLLLMHWLAAVWFFSAFAAGFPSDSWAARAGIVDAGSGEQYVRSLYWVITTMTTVGYGDITPERTAEYLLASFIMLLGASLYAFIIGSIASLLSQIRAARNRHEERVDAVTDFLRQRQVPAELSSKVRNYYDYVWQRYSGEDSNRILDDLPGSLRREIMLHLAAEIIDTVPLFHHCTPVLRDALLDCLQARSIPPGSYINREGNPGRAIYFIVSGEVEIISLEHNRSWGEMRDGDYFGLMSLVLNEKCTATTMARAFTDLLVLSADDFERIKADYPELRDALSRASSQQTGHLSQLLLEGVVL